MHGKFSNRGKTFSDYILIIHFRELYFTKDLI